MLILRTLGETDICQLYESRMRQDFPPSELKHLSSILTMVARDEYDVICAYTAECEPVAYALMYRPKNERPHPGSVTSVFRHRGHPRILLRRDRQGS